MELLTPGVGLIFWQVAIFFSLLLTIIAWVMIFRAKELDATKKLIWLMGTSILPVVGAVYFFISRSSLKNGQ
jgi:hypothetical protein